MYVVIRNTITTNNSNDNRNLKGGNVLIGLLQGSVGKVCPSGFTPNDKTNIVLSETLVVLI